jgi:hypothetical protein
LYALLSVALADQEGGLEGYASGAAEGQKLRAPLMEIASYPLLRKVGRQCSITRLLLYSVVLASLRA